MGSTNENSAVISELRDNLRKAVDQGVRSVMGSYPALGIYKTDDAVIIETQPLTGLNRTSIDVSILGSELTISGETQAPEDIPQEAYLKRERVFGAFSRTVTIPLAVKAEAARAKVKAGVLTITLPRQTEDDSEIVSIHVAH